MIKKYKQKNDHADPQDNKMHGNNGRMLQECKDKGKGSDGCSSPKDVQKCSGVVTGCTEKCGS